MYSPVLISNVVSGDIKILQIGMLSKISIKIFKISPNIANIFTHNLKSVKGK